MSFVSTTGALFPVSPGSFLLVEVFCCIGGQGVWVRVFGLNNPRCAGCCELSLEAQMWIHILCCRCRPATASSLKNVSWARGYAGEFGVNPMPVETATSL